MWRRIGQASEPMLCCSGHWEPAGWLGLPKLPCIGANTWLFFARGVRVIILHTMFYEPEIRREDECRPDLSQVLENELELALLLVNSLAAPFETAKYRDSYREKLDALIAAKLEGKAPVEPEVPRTASVVNILDALKRSLESSGRKPTVGERSIARKKKSRER